MKSLKRYLIFDFAFCGEREETEILIFYNNKSSEDVILCREKGYYSNVEVLEGIIRSRFSGTATCVGNPGLRQADRSTVEVSRDEAVPL